MDIDPRVIQDGNRLKDELKSNPSTFGSDGGVSKPQARSLDKSSPTRMAGEMGARYLAMVSDPSEAERTDQWMEMFGQSNQGAEFNQSKLNQAMQLADQKAGVI